MLNLPTTPGFVQQMQASIRQCIEDYQLVLGKKVALGLSGGKDSTSLLMLLREMSIDVTPVIVDLGYRNFDAAAISAACRRMGTAPIVASRDDPETVYRISSHSQSRLESSLKAIDSPDNMSPCGPCSRAKRFLLLSAARKVGAESVVLGHQQYDFLATLLKDYFIERYLRTSTAYEPNQFRAFIAQDPIDTSLLKAMVMKNRAATMGVRARLSADIAILRPMAYVPEPDIMRLVEETGAAVFGSGCSHDALQDPDAAPSKRELVHAELVTRLRRRPELAGKLSRIAQSSLDARGVPRCNPRKHRDARCPGFVS